MPALDDFDGLLHCTQLTFEVSILVVRLVYGLNVGLSYFPAKAPLQWLSYLNIGHSCS
jgi:hypothetical protein